MASAPMKALRQECSPLILLPVIFLIMSRWHFIQAIYIIVRLCCWSCLTKQRVLGERIELQPIIDVSAYHIHEISLS